MTDAVQTIQCALNVQWFAAHTISGRSSADSISRVWNVETNHFSKYAQLTRQKYFKRFSLATKENAIIIIFYR